MEAVRWLIRLLFQYGKLKAVEKVFGYGRGIFKEFLKIKVIDVPGEFVIKDIATDLSLGTNDFRSIDIDFNQKTIYKSFKSPASGKYKLVSFCPNLFPGGVGMIEMLLVTQLKFSRFGFVKPANVSELISVGESCDYKALGLGDNYSMATLGTIVKKSSVTFSICYPVISFNAKEIENKTVREKSLSLRDVSNPCPPGHHFLFRVD